MEGNDALDRIGQLEAEHHETEAGETIKPGDVVRDFGFFVAGICVGWGGAYENVPLVLIGASIETMLLAWPYSSFARRAKERTDG